MLSEEQRMIQDTARAFARDRLSPNAAAWDRESRFPAEAIAEMGKVGLMGIQVPEAYGGSDAGMTALAVALEEIAAGDGATSTIASVHNGLGMMPILQYGSDEQKNHWLPNIASGKCLTAFALTEPHVGSDAGAIKAKAERRGNGWRLSGTKQFVTSGSTARLMVTFAVTDPAAGKKGISAFLVQTDTRGYTVARKETKLGQKASDTCQIIFDDMDLPADALLGAEGQGYRIALSNLEGGRIGIAAQAVGMARAAFDAALAYAKEREAFGKKIGKHQAVSFRLADMATAIEAARLMYLNAARMRDEGKPCLKEASMAKLFASEMAEKVCSDAIQIHGGYGYVDDFPVERIYRDVRVCQIYEGTSDIQRLVIGRALQEG